MFTLAKLSYCACEENEKLFYDKLETSKVDVKSCCIDILKYLQNKTDYLNNIICNNNIDLFYGSKYRN